MKVQTDLEHFVAEFNLPVLLLSRILTYIVNIPVDKTMKRTCNYDPLLCDNLGKQVKP